MFKLCPLIFQEVDIEAGEKDELLDKEGKETDSNKKVDGDDLEDVKVTRRRLENSMMLGTLEV
jgi:hypothetical protein